MVASCEPGEAELYSRSETISAAERDQIQGHSGRIRAQQGVMGVAHTPRIQPSETETAATPDVDDSDLTIAQRNALRRRLKPRTAHAHLVDLASGQHHASVMALHSFYSFKVVADDYCFPFC